jgi:aryl-alcohol dehydrogenase-like predicted oxidoreductase
MRDMLLSAGSHAADDVSGDVAGDRATDTAVDVGGGLLHSLEPEFLRVSLSQSLANLGLDTVDVYYLHNPEIQLQAVGPGEFKKRFRRAFDHLEEDAAAGRIRLYGVATWDGLRTDIQNRIYLPLTLLEEIAREVGGDKHRFRFIQLPYNILERTPFSGRNQPLPGGQAPAGGDPVGAGPTLGPVLAAAMQLGVAAMASASLAQGRVLERLPAQFGRTLGEWDTRAQAALQFVRSTPGVTTALVGMARVAHVQENLVVAAHAPLARDRFLRLFQRPA